MNLVKQDRKVPRELEKYGREVSYFTDFCDEKGLSILAGYGQYADKLDIGYEKGGLFRTYAAATFNKRMAAARAYIRYAFEYSDKVMDGLTRHHVETLLKSVKYRRVQAGQVTAHITQDEADFLFAQIPNKKMCLFYRFLFSTGARISETLRIRITDIKQNTPGFLAIRVLGKGSKERTLFIGTSLYNEIREAFQGSEYLFEKTTGGPYSRIYITNYLRDISLKVLGFQISAHSLRHSFATAHIAKKTELTGLSKYLGHSSTAITSALYVHTSLSPQEAVL